MTHHNFQVTELPIQGKLVQQATLLSIQAWLCWKHYLPIIISIHRALTVACIWFWPLEYYTCMTCYVSPLLKGICVILALKMLLAEEQICDVMLCLVWWLLIPVHMMSMLGWSSTPRCFRYWDSLTLGTALEAQYSDNISWELYSQVIQ